MKLQKVVVSTTAVPSPLTLVMLTLGAAATCSSPCFYLSLFFFVRKENIKAAGSRALGQQLCLTYRTKRIGWNQLFSAAGHYHRTSFYPNVVICQSPQCLPQLLRVYLAVLGSASSLVGAVVNEIKGLGLSLLPLGATLELLFFLALLELHCSCATAVGAWSRASSVLTWTHWLDFQPSPQTSCWQTFPGDQMA